MCWPGWHWATCKPAARPGLGGSVYEFLKSAQVAEFPLDETFRLNAPLPRFTESKFYPGRYRPTSASADRRLRLADGWDQDAASWERIALDPDYPLCILLHDGPTARTGESGVAGEPAWPPARSPAAPRVDLLNTQHGLTDGDT